jgi:hypothetical protein
MSWSEDGVHLQVKISINVVESHLDACCGVVSGTVCDCGVSSGALYHWLFLQMTAHLQLLNRSPYRSDVWLTGSAEALCCLFSSHQL